MIYPLGCLWLHLRETLTERGFHKRKFGYLTLLEDQSWESPGHISIMAQEYSIFPSVILNASVRMG